MMRAEVLVVGGGPAGAATALTLARAGVSVVLLERSQFFAPRVGETLPPQSCVTLAQLGVWDRFLRDGHLASPGIVSIWGGEAFYENDFIFNPFGTGWHLDRCLFDRMMIEAAEQAGTRVYRGARTLKWRFTESNTWEVDVSIDGVAYTGEYSFLVDATGRAAAIARRCGTQRVMLDQLVGVVGFFEDVCEQDARTLVEACKDGWWYSARLPAQRLVVALMTDADFVPRSKEQLQAYWRTCLLQAPYTLQRVEPTQSTLDLRIVAAHSSRLAEVVGEKWLAVGDAAMAFDPLSSHGITTALESGQLAATCIGRHLGGTEQSLEPYRQWVADRYEVYWRERTHYYRREDRWPESVFWRRRSLAEASPPGAESALEGDWRVGL